MAAPDGGVDARRRGERHGLPRPLVHALAIALVLGVVLVCGALLVLPGPGLLLLVLPLQCAALVGALVVLLRRRG